MLGQLHSQEIMFLHHSSTHLSGKYVLWWDAGGVSPTPCPGGRRGRALAPHGVTLFNKNTSNRILSLFPPRVSFPAFLVCLCITSKMNYSLSNNFPRLHFGGNPEEHLQIGGNVLGPRWHIVGTLTPRKSVVQPHRDRLLTGGILGCGEEYMRAAVSGFCLS